MSRRDSQVTTKRGDHGETTALSGEHYSKAHPIMECTGAVDELRAQTALVRILLINASTQGHARSSLSSGENEASSPRPERPQHESPGQRPGSTSNVNASPEGAQQLPYTDEIEFLHWLLHIYFLIGAQCSDPTNRHPEYRIADLGPQHLAHLETIQANLESRVTLPKAFILSAANPIAAHTDIAATTARRLERAIVRLQQTLPDFDTTNLLPFINRLSDTLFMLARLLDNGDYQAVDYDVLKTDAEVSSESEG